jgi:hypothetical protein
MVGLTILTPGFRVQVRAMGNYSRRLTYHVVEPRPRGGTPPPAEAPNCQFWQRRAQLRAGLCLVARHVV